MARQSLDDQRFDAQGAVDTNKCSASSFTDGFKAGLFAKVVQPVPLNGLRVGRLKGFVRKDVFAIMG